MTFKNTKAIFWDFDGPILEHFGGVNFYWEALEEAVKYYELCNGCAKRRMEIVQGFTHDKYETLFDYLHHEFGIDYQMAMEKHHELLLNNFSHKYRLANGFEFVASKLKNQFSHVVVTHSHENWTSVWEERFPKINHLIDSYFYPKQHGFGDKSKNSEAYKTVLDYTGFLAKEVIMIEDSHKNLKAAKEIGMKTILVDLYDAEDTQYADEVVKSIAEIPALVL